MSDIVERLRESAQYWVNEVDTRKEAADEIERLRGLLRDARNAIGGKYSNIDLRNRIDAALAGAAGRPHWSSDDPSVTITPQGEMSVDPECLTCGRSTKRHPGYVIGNHWLESAYERICAGEAEDDVLRDYDVFRVNITEPPLPRIAAWLDYWRTTMPTIAANALIDIIRSQAAADQPSVVRCFTCENSAPRTPGRICVECGRTIAYPTDAAP